MDIGVQTRVTAVTVYPDRARVTCQGACELPAGKHRLLIDELPLAMETDSVRVGGAGTVQVRIHSVDIQRRYYEETPAARVHELEQAIEAAEAALQALKDDQAGWLAHGKTLDGLRQATAEYAKGLARGRMDVAAQAALLEWLRDQDQEMRAAVRELEQQKPRLERRLERLRAELKALQGARRRQRFRILVDVTAAADGNFVAALHYVVGQAGWQPLYDLRLDTEADKAGPELALTYLAEVVQSTGQPWSGVRLALSTARPALNQRLPELKPWFIDEYHPPVPREAVRMRAQLAAAPAAESAAKAAPAAVQAATAEVATATVSESATAVTFDVDATVDIPDDGSPHKTTIASWRFPVALTYLAIPKHTDAVFRQARLTHSAPAPLLPGSAALFAGDEFIGQTRLAYTATGDELELLLGVEDRITVERELARRDVDKRFLRDQRQLRFGYRLQVANLLSYPVTLEVQDQFPVSRHDEIRVTLLEAKPAPQEQSELHLVEWRLELEPGQEQVIALAFQVEHPRGMRIAGLVD